MFVCVKSNKQLFQIAGFCCLLAVVNVVVVGKKMKQFRIKRTCDTIDIR